MISIENIKSLCAADPRAADFFSQFQEELVNDLIAEANVDLAVALDQGRLDSGEEMAVHLINAFTEIFYKLEELSGRGWRDGWRGTIQ